MSETILALDLGRTRYRAGLASSDDPAVVRPIDSRPAPQTRARLVALIGSQLREFGALRLGLAIPGLNEAAICS